MNKFEKQVFNSLSEEEQEKIAGSGPLPKEDALTPEQCDKLRTAAETTKNPEFTNLLMHNLVIMYGLPRPRIQNWRTTTDKPLNHKTPEHPIEPPTNTNSERNEPR